MPKKLAKPSPSAPPLSSSSADALVRILADGSPLPRLVVFDLDYTLWPFWVDTHVSGKLGAVPGTGGTACADRTGERFAFYRDVPAILNTLPQLNGTRVGVASRTCAPDLAREMLKLLQIHPPEAAGKRAEKPKRAIDLFDAGLQIYPGSKISHMQKLHKDTGIPYEEMLFFDDESRNRDTESLGVTMCLVKDGVTWGELERGIKEWRRRRGYVKPDQGEEDE